MSARSRLSRSLLATLLLMTAPSLALAREVPVLTGPVVDEAGVVEPAEWGRLVLLLHAAWDQPPHRRAQLQILVVRSLEGEDIEGFAVRVFEQWKLGEKDKDNGVLIVVSKEDRRMRIETGYGAEGALTDAQAGRIIRNTLAPAFREGRYGAGLYDASVEVLSALGALPEGTARSSPAGLGVIAVLGSAVLLLLPFALVMFPVLFIILIIFILAAQRRGRRGAGLDTDWSGSRFESLGSSSGDYGGSGGSSVSGGSSGGDWSGGGGQSGGGGASGSW